MNCMMVVCDDDISFDSHERIRPDSGEVNLPPGLPVAELVRVPRSPEALSSWTAASNIILY
jgi:hypothetical protein